MLKAFHIRGILFAVCLVVRGYEPSEVTTLLQLRNGTSIVANLQQIKRSCLRGGDDCLPLLRLYRTLAWPQIAAVQGPWLSPSPGWFPDLRFDTQDDGLAALPCADGTKLMTFYRHIWKSAGWSIFGNLGHVKGGVFGIVGSTEFCQYFDPHNASHFSFTFARNPITRFVSAYAEIEDRVRQGNIAFQHLKDILDRFPAGSLPRATAFLQEFLKDGINGGDGHVKPQVEFLGSSQGCRIPIHFVGSVEHMAEDWARMFESRPCQPAVAFDPLLGQHANAATDKAAMEEVLRPQAEAERVQYISDFLELSASGSQASQTAAMEELLRSGMHMRSLCWIYLPDFVVFGYELPELCQEDPALQSILERSRNL